MKRRDVWVVMEGRCMNVSWKVNITPPERTGKIEAVIEHGEVVLISDTFNYFPIIFMT